MRKLKGRPQIQMAILIYFNLVGYLPLKDLDAFRYKVQTVTIGWLTQTILAFLHSPVKTPQESELLRVR